MILENLHLPIPSSAFKANHDIKSLKLVDGNNTDYDSRKHSKDVL